MSNCVICNNSNAPVYDMVTDAFYCNACTYWDSRAKGRTFGWQELTELLEDDSITYKDMSNVDGGTIDEPSNGEG